MASTIAGSIIANLLSDVYGSTTKNKIFTVPLDRPTQFTLMTKEQLKKEYCTTKKPIKKKIENERDIMRKILRRL